MIIVFFWILIEEYAPGAREWFVCLKAIDNTRWFGKGEARGRENRLNVTAKREEIRAYIC